MVARCVHYGLGSLYTAYIDWWLKNTEDKYSTHAHTRAKHSNDGVAATAAVSNANQRRGHAMFFGKREPASICLTIWIGQWLSFASVRMCSKCVKSFSATEINKFKKNWSVAVMNGSVHVAYITAFVYSLLVWQMANIFPWSYFMFRFGVAYWCQWKWKPHQTVNITQSDNNRYHHQYRKIINLFDRMHYITYLTLLWSMSCWRCCFRSRLLHTGNWCWCPDILIDALRIVIINTVIVIVVSICGDGISMGNVVYDNAFSSCCRWTIHVSICCPIAIGGYCNWASGNEKGTKIGIIKNHKQIFSIYVCLLRWIAVDCGGLYVSV